VIAVTRVVVGADKISKRTRTLSDVRGFKDPLVRAASIAAPVRFPPQFPGARDGHIWEETFMKSVAQFALAGLLLVGVAGAAAAQQTYPSDTIRKQASLQRTVPDSLLSQVKVSEDSARALAMARVPNGTLQAIVLERRRGKLVWSFAIRDPARPRSTEVYVNAMDGSILNPTQKPAS
jgi:uncharacterized membrane protein YkoI